ncbi:MAG: YraN family protein [Cryomorphaceae bacterium]|nr:YraN family protein [Cryomorphaceae bacterium]
MATHNELGTAGEDLAGAHLEELGFTILERNFRYGRIEIDLIVQNDEFIVAVEVKSRKSAPRSDYFQAVGRNKINSMVRGLEFYMKKYGITQETRFDMICVYMGGKSPYVEHIPRFFVP